MDKLVRFTKHARKKFDDLKELGFTVSEQQVLETISNPEKVDRTVDPPIAQKSVSERHVLRVVFVEEDDEIRVVTFYPGRKDRYEDEV